MIRLTSRWQLGSLVGAILIPSVVLVAVSQRTIRQNWELAGKRQADERHAAKERIARDLLAQLESLKQTAARKPGTNDARIVLMAELESGQLLPAAETDPAIRRSAAFARTAQLETAANQPEAALRAKVAAAHDPFQVAYLRLLLARALLERQAPAQGAVEARLVLAAPPDFVDEDGTPLAIRAAALLAGSPAEFPAIRRAVDATFAARRADSPLATYALQNLAQQLETVATPEARPWIAQLRDRVAGAIATQGQINELQKDGPQLAALASWAAAATPRWALYGGGQPWLLSAVARPHAGALVVAVAARELFRPFETAGIRFPGPTEAGGELLGDAFPGVRIELPQRELPESADLRMQSGLYYLALFVLLAATGLGALLLWRSMRGEMQLAETRAQFVSSVSHELKTPITAIRMFAETLEMRPTDEEVRREYLETIINECGRLSRLVDDVLLFSKIEQGKKVYRFRPVELPSHVRNVARILSYQLAQHGFDLRLSLDEDLPPVQGDPDALEQAIMNLITNAMKYSGESRQIDVVLARGSAGADLSVTDYGIGIAPEEQARIFEKYYRVQAPENRSIPGTGLGLTLVSQIARGHNGTVEVRSMPGKGSTFTLKLPFGGPA